MEKTHLLRWNDFARRSTSHGTSDPGILFSSTLLHIQNVAYVTASVSNLSAVPHRDSILWFLQLVSQCSGVSATRCGCNWVGVVAWKRHSWMLLRECEFEHCNVVAACTPHVVAKTPPSEVAALFDWTLSRQCQTLFPWTGRRFRSTTAQDSMRNMRICSSAVSALFLLRDQWMIERLMEAMSAAFVWKKSLRTPSKFYYPWKQNLSSRLKASNFEKHQNIFGSRTQSVSQEC